MAKAKSRNTNFDAKEFFKALSDIEKEKGIPRDYLMEKITQALVTAYKKDHEGVQDNVFIDANEARGTVKMFIRKEVVETVDNPGTEISLEAANKDLPNAKVGDIIRLEIKPKNFGRIAAMAARQVIIQGVREAERGMVYQEFSGKEHEIITGTIVRTDERTGAVVVKLSSRSETTEAFLSASERVRGEVYNDGDTIRVYVVEVRRSTKGPQVLISRSHQGLVKRLFELEVPEIYDGTVEVKSIAREAGSRTKIAVCSSDPNVDPIGACVGPKGQRVNAVVSELKGEKIDIVKYSDNPCKFVAEALSPASVESVTVVEEGKSCRVVVPDDQLSLAIGKEGQNARLAARLTGFKIDIRPSSAPLSQEELEAEAAAQQQPSEAAEAAGSDEDEVLVQGDEGESPEAEAGAEPEAAAEAEDEAQPVSEDAAPESSEDAGSEAAPNPDDELIDAE